MLLCTPRKIVERVSAEMRKIVQTITINAVLRVQGVDAIAGKPPGFKERIRSGLVNRASIIKAASVRAI